MADYYPLISRAVAGLEKNNGENRRALYERARAALIAQLRGVTPALPESDITRERLALEESIRKVEAEAARQFVEASRQARAAKVRSRRAALDRSPVRYRIESGAATARISVQHRSRRRSAPSPRSPPDLGRRVGRAFAAADAAGCAASGFDLRSAAAAGAVAAPAAASLWRRAARILGRRPRGGPFRCQGSGRGLGAGRHVRT